MVRVFVVDDSPPPAGCFGSSWLSETDSMSSGEAVSAGDCLARVAGFAPDVAVDGLSRVPPPDPRPSRARSGCPSRCRPPAGFVWARVRALGTCPRLSDLLDDEVAVVA